MSYETMPKKYKHAGVLAAVALYGDKQERDAAISEINVPREDYPELVLVFRKAVDKLKMTAPANAVEAAQFETTIARLSEAIHDFEAAYRRAEGPEEEEGPTP